MEITFDPAKDAINKEGHDGISLADACRLDWNSLRYEVNTWFNYGEERYRGFGQSAIGCIWSHSRSEMKPCASSACAKRTLER
jgi:uncharacterized DUF497 family protein